jgi:hypothetical protein
MHLPRPLIAVAAGAAIIFCGSLALTPGAHARTVEGKIAFIGQDPQGGKNADTVVHIANKGYRVSTRPKVLIAGRVADVSELKPRMQCRVTLSHNEAREFVCKRRPIAEF